MVAKKLGHLLGYFTSLACLQCFDLELTPLPPKPFSGPILPPVEDLSGHFAPCNSPFEMDGDEAFLTIPTLNPVGLSAREKLFPLILGRQKPNVGGRMG